jgi:Xaa-Pro aminopeptidase
MKLNRLNKILSKMQENNIPQMLVTDPKAIFYLTGKMIHPEERLIALYLNTNGNHKLFINTLNNSGNSEAGGYEIGDYIDFISVMIKDNKVSVRLSLSKNKEKYETEFNCYIKDF